MRPRNCACDTVPVVGNGHGVACAEDENLYKFTVWRKVGDCLNETFYPRDMSVKPLDYHLIALNGTERNRSKKHPIEEREQHLGWKQHSCGTSIPWHVGDKPNEPDTYLPSSTKASQSNKAPGQGKGQEEEKSTKQKQLKQFRLKPLVKLISSASSVDFPVLVDSLNSSEGEGAASIALPVKTLGLGASVSSVHPRSAGQITTRAGSIESFSSAHVPTTTSAAILTSMEGYGGSPAAAPTPLPGALI
ncbi:hypothetical protein L1987_45932 [Smallanthus sonchifolius]|uniref:Uncharacterized protein n=1 Tax=Smallanthus sonchifolius TaxID=185202 RepID=A0ACB9FZC4_9ASTR|nr:hypothetical protein L1987_45932 [Smallanthus sonchifolius]